MGEFTRQPARDIKSALIDSVLAGLCALIVFGPIVGVVLKGYGFTLAPARVAILVAVVMAGRLALSLLLQSRRGKAFIARFEGADDGVYVRPPGYRSRLRWIMPLLVVLAIAFPFLASKYLLTVAILGLIYVLLGLGLNIVVGLAGLLDLGYVAFYAIGAYGLALGYQYLGLGFWAMLPLGAVMAALAGALLGFPVLRMHGDYLAIVTLGFGEIIRLVLNNWVSFTGGPNGVPVPSPTLFGLEFTRRARDGGIPIHEFFHVSYNPNLKFIFLYAVLCLVVMLVLLVKHRLTRMPIGRAWEALREDEIACRAMGLNHVLVKLSAFMLGASTAGIAGVFFASYQGFVNPTSFTFFESALILAIVVLGGMGSTLGVVLAAFVLTVTPELLRGFDEYRVLLFGVLMVMGLGLSSLSQIDPSCLFFILSALFVSINAFLIKSVQRSPVNPVSNRVIAYYNNFITMLFFLATAAAMHTFDQFARIGSSRPLALALLIAGLGQTLVYIVYYYNLSHFPVWLVKIFLLFMPVVSSVISFVLFDEQLGGKQIAGMLVVLIGALGILIEQRRKEEGELANQM